MKQSLFILLLFFTTILLAQNPENRSVQVSAKVQHDPPKIDFSWPWDWSSGGYTIYKKQLEDPSWGEPLATLPWGATEWTDENVTVGEGAEYAFFKKDWGVMRDTFWVKGGSELLFEIGNIQGHGICCNYGTGQYQLYACGELIAEGGNFGFGESKIFTLCGDTSEMMPVVLHIVPDLFPKNMIWDLIDASNFENLATSGPAGTLDMELAKYGFIYAGIDLPPIEYQGTVLVLVDSTYTLPLLLELRDLQHDMIRDGWQMLRQDINPNASVEEVKTHIKLVAQFVEDLKMIMIIGHVPVPYSGSMYPDGHIENHWGAWAADSYYGDLDGVWTDSLINNTAAFLPWNHNVPNDGKFDQSLIPTKMELAVGRVDLTDLPSFDLDDIELTRRYLKKNHLFRTGQFDIARRALVDDNINVVLGAPAASGYRNFAPMFGADSVHKVDYFSAMREETYLWSYGGGSGTHHSADGIGSTASFASDSLNGIFTMLFGSQFGDWDNSDNFLRAPLASGLTLTSCWAGNPAYTFHHMAMGYPIGYSLLRTQNATIDDYLPGPQLVHTSLLGDPTLRLHPMPMMKDLAIDTTSSTIELTWVASPDTAVLGYYIYRADSLTGRFERFQESAVTDTFFTIMKPEEGHHVFMVRALKLETSGSGTYYNLSAGIFDTVTFTYPEIIDNVTLVEYPEVSIQPNPTSDFVEIAFVKNSSFPLTVKVLDNLGRVVLKKSLPSATQQISLNLKGLSTGIYFLKLENKEGEQVKKLLVR